MKISIDRIKFLQALNVVKDSVANDAVPILKNIKMETKGDSSLVLTATNLDVCVSTTVGCRISVPGATTVPARLFVSMVNALSDPTVEFSCDDCGGKAVLSSGEATYRISTLAAEEFPKQADVEGVRMSFGQKEFKDMLRKTSYAASVDSTRRSLMSLCLQGSAEDGRVYSVCTDGRRLASYSKPKDGVEKFEMLIPSVAVRFLYRSLDGDGDVDITIGQGKAALFRTEGWSIQTKICEDAYPSWKNVIPRDLAHHVIVDRSRFIEGVRQASISSAEDNSHVVISFRTGTMAVSAAREGLSDATVLIPVKYDGNECSVRLNPKYVLDILGSLDDDEVSVNFNDGTKPITVTCADEGVVDVCMPLRIN